MARSVFTVQYNGDSAKAQALIQRFADGEGFKLVEYNGGQCYKLGVGMAQAMQFFAVPFAAGEIILEGWICAGVGNATLKEMDLKGMVGALPKKLLKKRIEQLCDELRRHVGVN